MQDCYSNPIFWEALIAFLHKYKDSPSKMSDILKEHYVDIPQDVIDIYSKIATIGRDQGLHFNYIEDAGTEQKLFSDIINDSSINGQEVLDYYIPILRMVKAMLVLVVGRITS